MDQEGQLVAELVYRLKERSAWACRDAWTYVFAKVQPDFRRFESELGGGNMAKPLILFPLWDVMAGIYVFASGHHARLVWTQTQVDKLKHIKEKLEEVKGQEQAGLALAKKIRFIVPKAGTLTGDEDALEIFLSDFAAHCNLGVKARIFARQVRPNFRNPLAHTYAPRVGGSASSLVPVVENFRKTQEWGRTRNDSVVLELTPQPSIDGLAMLRDSELLTHALADFLTQHCNEAEAGRALEWLIK